MKKSILVLIVLFFCSGLFAKSIIKEIDIKDVSDFIDYEVSDEESYTLQIKDNFKPEDVTVSEIKALSKFMSLNADNKIEGPIEYVYFDGEHSAGVFYEIRQKIDNAKDKFVCVDLSNSDYFFNDDYDTYYLLPKNTFAGHENLYWVYLGSFGREDVPANLCKDCKNLQFVMMWNYGKVDDTAFSGVNDNAKLYDKEGNESPLALIHQVKAEEYDNWDYLAFTEEDYKKYTAKNSYEEDEFEDDYSDDDFGVDDFLDIVYMLYEKAMEDIDFSELIGEEGLKISASNAEQILSNRNFDKTNSNSVAIQFLCNYLLGNEKSDIEISLNERYTSVFDLSNIVFHISTEEDETPNIVSFGIEGNGGSVRDVCLLLLEKDEEENWSVSQLKTFCLLSYMIGPILEE